MFIAQQQNNQRKYILTPFKMIRQSEIGSFLDLIKHISDRKQMEKSWKKRKKTPNRYDIEQEEINESQKNDEVYDHMTRSSADMYYHKKLPISLEKKKNHYSFKLENITNNLGSQNEKKYSKESERKNLYSLYCQDIQKKRDGKQNNIFQEKPQFKHRSFRGIKESTVAISFDKKGQQESLRRQKSMPPVGKSKLMKNLLESGKEKNKQLKNKNMKGSQNKVQPSELNIGTIGEFKMPKINQNSTHISELRSTFKIPYGHFESSKRKKAKISKGLDITGWGSEDDNHKFFHVDLF